jgi:hypothetical protein
MSQQSTIKVAFTENVNKYFKQIGTMHPLLLLLPTQAAHLPDSSFINSTKYLVMRFLNDH